MFKATWTTFAMCFASSMANYWTFNPTYSSGIESKPSIPAWTQNSSFLSTITSMMYAMSYARLCHSPSQLEHTEDGVTFVVHVMTSRTIDGWKGAGQDECYTYGGQNQMQDSINGIFSLEYQAGLSSRCCLLQEFDQSAGDHRPWQGRVAYATFLATNETARKHALEEAIAACPPVSNWT